MPHCKHLQLSPHLLAAPDDTAAQVATGLGVDHGWGVLLALQVSEVDSPTLSFLPETGKQKRRKEGKKQRKRVDQKRSCGTGLEGEPAASAHPAFSPKLAVTSLHRGTSAGPHHSRGAPPGQCSWHRPPCGWEAPAHHTRHQRL